MIDLTHIHIGWPQGIYLSLIAIVLLMNAIHHGESRPSKYNFPVAVIVQLFLLVLLLSGGFFGGIQ